MRFWLCLALLLLSGCNNLQNRIDNQVLDCGDEVRGSSDFWIKVLDPTGEELAKTERLDARPLQLDAAGGLPPALEVSEKHCVRAESITQLVIRSRATDRSWSVLVVTDDLTWDRRVRLQDSSQQSLRLQCPNPWVSNGRMGLPLVANGGLPADVVALSTALSGPDGRRWTGAFSLHNDPSSVAWPLDWPDGSGLLTVQQRNFLQNESSGLAQKEETCAVVVDRVSPTLELTPAAPAEGALEMQPGALLRVRIADEHPGTLRWCLGGPGDCTDEKLWEEAAGEVSLTMPDKGRWILSARAVDAAGNVSALLQQTIDVIQTDVINTIAARIDQALAQKNADGWQAGFSLLQALQDYQRLVLPQEQERIKPKLVDGILAAAPSIQERNRSLLPGQARRVWALNQDPESPWLVLTSTELSLWSKQGKNLQKMTVDDAMAADWSEERQSLVLGSADQLQVIGIKGTEFSRLGTLRWEDVDIYGTPAEVKWIPQSASIIAAVRGDVPALFQLQADGLKLSQQLDLKDTARLSVSPDGQLLAGTSFDQVTVWQNQQGVWTTVDTDELSVKDLQFTAKTSHAASRLLILLSDGRLTSWSADRIWKEIDKGVPGEFPTESPDGRRVQHLQSWADGTSGILERGGRFYQWSGDLSKTLQLVKMSGFAWDQLQQWKVDRCRQGIWMQDRRTLSYWQWQQGKVPGLVKQGEFVVAPDVVIDSVSNCNADDREFITLDASQNRLRFWSQRGPLAMVPGDADTTVVSHFSEGLPEGEALFTAGFDGVIRAWNQLGKKLRVFTGHVGQINEMRFVPEWNQFLSSAEDNSSRLWSIDGKEQAILSTASVPNTPLHDSSILLDPQHIVTAGSGVVGLWTYDRNQWKLTITISLAIGERAYFDALVRIPARAATATANSAVAATLASAAPARSSGERVREADDAAQAATRVLVRLKDKNWRGLFIQASGAVQNREPGLPELENLQRLEWSSDGTRLALVDKRAVMSVYHQTANGWQEEQLQTPLRSIHQFAFAPNGLSFAVLTGERTLQIWDYQNQWIKTAEQTLPTAVDMETGLRWTADGMQIIYAQSGLIRVHDRQLNIVHQFPAFPEPGRLTSFGVGRDPSYIAAGLGPWVRIIDFDLQRLQNQLRAFLLNSEDS